MSTTAPRAPQRERDAEQAEDSADEEEEDYRDGGRARDVVDRIREQRQVEAAVWARPNWSAS